MTDDEPSNSDVRVSDEESWLRELAHAPRLPAGRAVRSPALATTQSLQGAAQFVAVSAPPAQPSVGDVLDARYRLDNVLGMGGMGVVYTATQLSTGKQVAIKWMRAREQSPADRARAAARFVREARAAARIEHPNVVDVYDVCGDSMSPYLVMERLRGESLRERLERGPLSWEEAVGLIDPVLQALAQAHEAGVVHRDLKPDNLFLAQQTDGTSVLKVLDFGVSQLKGHDEDAEISLTRTGAVVGTPVYMPMEQLSGEQDLDGRTDVYSMGVVLYEALCGRRPYLARTAAEYGALLATSAPAPPSQLRPELRGAREAALLRALARDRGDRYPDMHAFRRALRDAVAERPLRGGQHRSVLLGLALLLALGLALAAWRGLGTWAARAPTDGPGPLTLPPAVVVPEPEQDPPSAAAPAAARPASAALPIPAAEQKAAGHEQPSSATPAVERREAERRPARPATRVRQGGLPDTMKAAPPALAPEEEPQGPAPAGGPQGSPSTMKPSEF